jgi:ABC-type multidrug transport system fused ATPase/permease subunit
MRLPYLSNVVTIFATDKAFSEESSIKNKVDKIESVKFESVSFAYANALKPSINQINFMIEHGQNIAIIGPSGSGKSTLIDLLLGLLEPDSGSILVNNNSLNDIDKQSYRAHYSYVPQKSYLIEDTLKENILFGSDERHDSEAEIAKILDLAEISPILNQLPNGIDTIISDSTIPFSGGQRQCIGLARALYRKGEILVLDESTNAMDIDLEKKILQSIPQSNFETKIFITHKINILRDVDKIIIMEKGSMIDSGNYDELLQRSQFLQKMLADANAEF